MASVKVLYFASVREKVGRGEEELTIPATVVTISDLVAWLRARAPEYEAAFAAPDTIRVAINQEHVHGDAEIAGAREVAFFPPVTGG